jgi:broad specificity phosphatase PhoE
MSNNTNKNIKLNVIYVRHMYSCANYSKSKGNLSFFTISDPSLHCVGVEQAKLLGEDFKKSGINIDMICTSQMFRAIQSGIIIRDTINKDIPILVVRHISEKGITPDNVPKKLKKITEEKARELNMTIDYNTDDKTTFKKFEKNIIPDILNTLISKKTKDEYTILVITHSHLLKYKFKKTLENGQMIFIQYTIPKKTSKIYEQKELPIPKELSSPYMNNQFYIYECTICKDIEDKNIDRSDFLIVDNLEKKMDLERFIIKKDIYETYKFKSHNTPYEIDMIIVKVPCDINENQVEKYLEKYRNKIGNLGNFGNVGNEKIIAGISSESSDTNLKKDIEDIKKTLIKLKPGCEEYNILFLQ